MKGLLAWLGWRRVALTAAQTSQLAAWAALPEPLPDEALDAARWVVIDVEASGLDLRRDHLISIGAVALHGTSLALADSFEVVLRQARASDHANILVHGMGGTVQREGDDPVDALLAFLHYAGKSRLVAFHAVFDQTMIGRALKAHLGLRFKRPALDLAYLAPAMYPEFSARRQGLDDWLARFGIRDIARHQALSDAYSSAQLMQILLQRAQQNGVENCADLIQQAQAQFCLYRMESRAL